MQSYVSFPYFCCSLFQSLLNKSIWKPVVYRTHSSISPFILKSLLLCIPVFQSFLVNFTLDLRLWAASRSVGHPVCSAKSISSCLSLSFSQVPEWSSIALRALQLLLLSCHTPWPSSICGGEFSLQHRLHHGPSLWLEALVIKLVSWAWLTFSKDIYAGG